MSNIRSSKTIARHYYHITTQRNWGERITLYPHKVDYSCDDEPTILRICVCPTVEGCFNAIWSCYCNPFGTYRIYRTVKKVIASRTYNVPDAHITGEMWLLKPYRFKYVGDINGREIYPLGRDYVAGAIGTADLQKQKKFLSELKGLKLLRCIKR